MSILEVRHLQKIYTSRLGLQKVEALKDITFSIEDGEYLAIMGESGSGKTTLLNILASLDKATAGEVKLRGKEMTTIPEAKLAGFRRKHLGFIFQDFNLINTFSLKDNIGLSLVLDGIHYTEIEKRVLEVAKILNIEKLLNKFPYEISGGEKQRCAVARAIITNPDLILADEPTGSLDSHNATELLNLFSEINENGQTILMVTHSVKAACKAKRVIFIKDGELFLTLYKKDLGDTEMYEKISDVLKVIARGDENYE